MSVKLKKVLLTGLHLRIFLFLINSFEFLAENYGGLRILRRGGWRHWIEICQIALCITNEWFDFI